MARLERDARVLCARFGLRYRVLEAERANVRRRYGVCFSDGTIRIRLRHATTGRALKYSSLVNTLCHELAHLEHFNHGPGFQAFYARILEYARGEGIYRPDPPGRAGLALASSAGSSTGSSAGMGWQTSRTDGRAPAARRSAQRFQPVLDSAATRPVAQLELFATATWNTKPAARNRER